MSTDTLEFLGQYQGSGLREPPYLIRRPDGQVVQVSRLIYLVAEALRPGEPEGPVEPEADRSLGGVAASISDAYGREISADNVAYLIQHKLAPAGLLSRPDGADAPGVDADDNGEDGDSDAAERRSPGTTESLARAKPLLALRMRVPLVPARAHRVASSALVPLFRLPIVIAALVGLVAVDVWLAGQGDALAWGLRGIIYQPQLLLMLTALTLTSAAFHELGHAAAARRGGAHPGAMGAGIYLVWPVFYTDVSDSYRLSRRGRLRTDLGGVYFNVLFALALTLAYAVTGFEPLLVSVVLTQAETLRQFLPFVRLDGYYVVSDLAGVPNLFSYMGPVLIGLLRRRDDAARQAARAKLQELNPWSRRLIVAWVAITTPVLLVNLVMLLVVAPRLAGAAWGSAGGQLRAMAGPDGALDPFRVVNGTIGVLFLALPVLGLGYIAVRSLRRAAAMVVAWWRNRPAPTVVVVGAVTIAVVLHVGTVWPDAFAGALRHAQESPAVEDVPAQIAGPPVLPHREPEPQHAMPPAGPTQTTTGPRAATTGRDDGGAPPAVTPPSTSASATTVTTRLAPRGNRDRRTTTTTAPTTTTTTAPAPDDAITELLDVLFPPDP
jgi:putative peptide zinc metalloprotease protein